MKLEVLRFRSKPDATFGILYDVTAGRRFLAYTLEDEYRLNKVSAETRIPAGTYQIELRTEGGHHERYAKKFSDIHGGMLWIRNVPGFQWILIHIGNTDEDTAGCLLVGSELDTQKEKIIDSTKAYKRVYVHVAEALRRGDDVSIEYIDYDEVG